MKTILNKEDLEFMNTDMELFADVISDDSYYYAQKIKQMHDKIKKLKESKKLLADAYDKRCTEIKDLELDAKAEFELLKVANSKIYNKNKQIKELKDKLNIKIMDNYSLHDKCDKVVQNSGHFEAEIKELREALEEISRGEGAYDLEPLKHAGNVIDNMMNIAKQALNQ